MTQLELDLAADQVVVVQVRPIRHIQQGLEPQAKVLREVQALHQALEVEAVAHSRLVIPTATLSVEMEKQLTSQVRL
jgi:hypothetical protein